MATLELPYEKVYDLLHKCCTSISPDVLYLMKRAAAKETNPEAKTFLETMLKNVELAGQMDKPYCQKQPSLDDLDVVRRHSGAGRRHEPIRLL